MTKGLTLKSDDPFEKRYPSAAAADLAMLRSHAARIAGVPTPAVLNRIGPLKLGFDRVVEAAPPTVAEMVQALRWLKGMPPDGLVRFDPFLRIRPRLDAAPPEVCALVQDLQARDAALRWSATTVIHGDFHPGQIIKDTAGKVWLLDLDDLALAPPEADLGNLAAWFATRTEGELRLLSKSALSLLLTLTREADPALTGHFFGIALVRRALKLAAKGQTWVLDQLPLRARDIVLLDPVTERIPADPQQGGGAGLVAMGGCQGL
jgi:Phosphotransferase enzyme family